MAVGSDPVGVTRFLRMHFCIAFSSQPDFACAEYIGKPTFHAVHDRRQHYRFSFAPGHRLLIRLETPDGRRTVTGRIVNLSVWGVCVQLDEAVMPTGDQWYATFTLEPDAALVVPMERIYAQDGAPSCCGFRFRRTLDLKENEARAQRIWRYLLDRQRQERRAQPKMAGP